MTRGFSLYLDALRFGAAFIVVLSHFGYSRFTGGRWLWVRELNLGSDAVIVFFVISGFVISHVAITKRATLGDFTFDRLTRLVSVALPALVLGFMLDRFGAPRSPEIYASAFFHPMPLWEMLLRGLTFSNEWSGLAARLGSNGPFWSLSYEAAYYALFAVAFYLRGPRRIVLLLAGVLLFGVNILILMPAWLMGVALHLAITRQRLPRGVAAAALAALPVLGYALALATGLPATLYDMTAGIDRALTLRFSNEFLWNFLLGLMVTAHLAGIAGLASDRAAARIAPAIRWLAGRSFSVYLVHYPVLQFLAAMPLKTGHAGLDDAILLTLTLTLTLAFGQVFESRLAQWRALLRTGLQMRHARRVQAE
ncbi:acyltransferase family protein [Sinisalibacter aestuarii]|uniref:Acyltransferase n=1 Tax=Sinisalibacter aestuarii TaxID=2949426 RepID=A0ABQ5LWG1_9RHOB|nr:acyltransferase [Sinisalibacter aestuarii]GKY89322.1 acyltransferase [Sinisalibacter aestuarii]